jgi:predicted CXXCH cytochrome family protein
MARSQRKSQKKSGSRGPTAPPPANAVAGEHPTGAERGALSRRGMLVGALLAGALLLAGGLSFQVWMADTPRRVLPSELPAATFVGSETCAGCHRSQSELWHGSQHQHAMDHATEKSVLGDFSGATFDYYGVRSRFFRKGDKFLVETDGPDGKLGTFEVKYTFGIDPLQQYLIQFPDGRLQALSIAWDSRPKGAGGQRWFHLYPNEEIRHNDILHWTKLDQNWNFMCAECHSTGVHKNYNAASDRFATTFSEISVGCEACHGQGSRHVSWAQDRKTWWPFGKTDDPGKGLIVRFDERSNVTWSINAKTGNATRSTAPATLRKEVETCGLCHARRGQFSENWSPGRWLSETHVVSPISRGLYHADGQMLDEVYNYGSFKQSKMFAAGVTCSDCHEPHSAQVRASGDGVCLQCHASDKYAAVAHHRHEGVNPPLGCASCHMPVRTYMVVDRRHDHSFRIPRPDLSVKLNTPNACNDCHSGKSAEWAAASIERWHGPERKGFQNYAAGLRAAWTGRADAATLLAGIAADPQAPGIARASALTELGSRVAPSNIDLARRGLTDPDPMVRIGALDMLEGLALTQRWPLASPLLADAVQGVRIRAASLLAGVPNTQLTASDRQRFGRAAEEFIAAQKLNADRPEARSMLGSFYAQREAPAEAETEYKAALRLSRQYTPAAINLADLYRRLQREADGEGVLRGAIVAAPQDAGVHHALGLTLVRLKRLDEALGELRRAAELAPEQARYAYVYAVALHSAGRGSEATATLKGNLAHHPDDRDTLLALVSFSRDAGDPTTALEYAEQLARVAPTDQTIAGLIENLRQQIKKSEPR